MSLGLVVLEELFTRTHMPTPQSDDIKMVTDSSLETKCWSAAICTVLAYCISGYFRGYLSSRMYTVGLLRKNLFSR